MIAANGRPCVTIGGQWKCRYDEEGEEVQLHDDVENLQRNLDRMRIKMRRLE